MDDDQTGDIRSIFDWPHPRVVVLAPRRAADTIRMGDHAPDCECLMSDIVGIEPGYPFVPGANRRCVGRKPIGNPLDCWTRWMAS